MICESVHCQLLGKENHHPLFQNQKKNPNESLANLIKRFDQEAVLILNLEDEVAYNSLKHGWFKFSLVEQKETSLVEALKKVADFI